MQLDTAIWAPSLRYRRGRSRNGTDFQPRVAIIHWSAGNGDAEAVARYMRAPTTTDPKTGQVRNRSASYHFAIGRPGEVYQLVDTDDTAWHAGDGSLWEALGSPARVNEQSVGISLCNKGPVTLDAVKMDAVRFVETPHNKPGFPRWRAFEAYTEAQRDTLLKVLRACKEAHPELRYLCGHQDVTRTKGDPGPLFETLDIGNDLRALQITRMVQDWNTRIWSPVQ